MRGLEGVDGGLVDSIPRRKSQSVELSFPEGTSTHLSFLSFLLPLLHLSTSRLASSVEVPLEDDDVGLELVAFGEDFVQLTVELGVSGSEVFVFGLAAAKCMIIRR